MDKKRILIEILTKFTDSGVRAARASVETLNAEMKAMQKQLNAAVRAETNIPKVQQRLDKAVTQELKQQISDRRRLISLSNQLTKALSREAAAATKASLSFKSFRGALRGTGQQLKGLLGKLGGVTSAFRALTLQNTLVGRVTFGFLTVQFWRAIGDAIGFATNAIVKGNAAMQSAIGTFTALSGGNRASADKFIAILKNLSVETGVAFDTLLENARRLPSKVGQNFQDFTKLTKAAIAIGMIDPAQGAEGAFFALTNALEGGAQGLRSLIQRFEIGTVKDFNEELDKTGNVVDALLGLLARSNIEVDAFIKAQRNTWPVVVMGLQTMLKEFLRVSTSPFFNRMTEDLARLRDWLQDNAAAVEALAQVIGDKLMVAYELFLSFIRELTGGKEITAASLFDGVVNAINGFVDFLHNAFVAIANLIANIANLISMLFGGPRVVEQVKQDARTVTDEVTAAAKETSKAVEETVESAAEAAQEIPEKIVKPLGSVVSSLKAIGDIGKRTTEQMVAGIIEGLNTETLEAATQAILSNVINLEAQEKRQEESIDKLEDWVNEAAAEVDAAKDRLKLFDLATEDIPERFTRARRRQLELEILRAEQEEKRRKAALDAAKEQLKITKEQLAAQEKVLALLEQALKEQEKAGQGVFTGFKDTDIDTTGFAEEVDRLKDIFSDRLQPTFDNIRDLFRDMADFVRGFVGADPAGQIEGMWAAGKKLREAIAGIAGGLGDLINKVDSIFAGFSDGWANLDPSMRKFLLVLLGIGALKNAGLITAAIRLVWSFGGLLANSATVGLKLLAALTGVSALTLGALAVSIVVLATLIWKGREELSKWITGQRPLELQVVLITKGIEAINKLLDFVGSDKQLDVGAITKPFADQIQQIKDEVAQDEGIVPSLLKWLSGVRLAQLAGKFYSAMRDNMKKPIVDVAQETSDEVVGNSIIPDMLSMVAQAIIDSTPRIKGAMIAMRVSIMMEMNAFRDEWLSDWDEMAAAVRNTMDMTDEAREESGRRTSSAVPKSVTERFREAARESDSSVNIRMDANETRRFMEEGFYERLAEFGRTTRGR